MDTKFHNKEFKSMPSPEVYNKDTLAFLAYERISTDRDRELILHKTNNLEYDNIHMFLQSKIRALKDRTMKEGEYNSFLYSSEKNILNNLIKQTPPIGDGISISYVL